MNIALVLSGGTGTRLGGDIPKQYIRSGDRMIISYCLEMFANHGNIDGIWIVANSAWEKDITDEFERICPGSDGIKGFSHPGDTRQLSILNGLRGIDGYVSSHGSASDVNVIIHDAARPNLSAKLVDECFLALEGYDGVMPVLPMKDTVYYSRDGKTVDSLLERENIYAGQAPEVYRLSAYLKANEELSPGQMAKIKGSTEPAVLAGLKVALIPGDENNFKITTKADLEKFETCL